MKTLPIVPLIILLVISCASSKPESEMVLNPKIDYKGFQKLTSDLQSYRQQRLVDIETFNAFASSENTIMLDTRSKRAYEQVHIKGAIHLNFSDFTDDKLAEIIPSKETRILIYCNNNLRSEKEALMDKRVELALNIPTFINLFGYGYQNIYELNGYLEEDDKRLSLVQNINSERLTSALQLK